MLYFENVIRQLPQNQQSWQTTGKKKGGLTQLVHINMLIFIPMKNLPFVESLAIVYTLDVLWFYIVVNPIN